MEIITTKEKIDGLIKFSMITALKYCIGNKLDFSIGIEEDEQVVAEGLYEEMWSSENNEFTKKFNETIR